MSEATKVLTPAIKASWMRHMVGLLLAEIGAVYREDPFNKKVLDLYPEQFYELARHIDKLNKKAEEHNLEVIFHLDAEFLPIEGNENEEGE